MYERETARGSGAFSNSAENSVDYGDNTHTYSREEVLDTLMLTVNQREEMLAACYQRPELFHMLQQLVDGGIGDSLRGADKDERYEIFEKFVAYSMFATREKMEVRCQLVGAGLLRLTARDGILGDNGGRFRDICLDSDRPLEAVRALHRAVENENESAWWWTRFQYALVLFTDAGRDFSSGGAYANFSVAEVPDRLPVAWSSDFDTSDIPAMKSFASMSRDEKKMYLSEQAMNEGYTEQTNIPFNLLNRDTKTTILAQQLFKSEVLSRDSQAKARSSERNRVLSTEENTSPLRPGSLVHSTKGVDTLRQILLNGIVCGEATGKSAEYDFFPFNVDLSKIEDVKCSSSPQLDYFYEYPISIVLYRDGTETGPDSARNVKESHINNHHVVFGAVPATDIGAIIYMPSARAASARMLSDIVDAVVENGMYIPVYRHGEKQPVLSFEEYQRHCNGYHV